jgi:sigma-B regulation protein RsbU (phosphoserine phosphatase)
VNGEQVTRRALRPGDRIQFGSLDAPQLRLGASEDRHTATGPNILSQLQGISAQHSDLEKLRWFLEAARELNSAGQGGPGAGVAAGDHAGAGQGGARIRLSDGRQWRAGNGSWQGCDRKVLTDAPTVSRTVMRQATRGTDQFIVTDTLTAEGEVAESIVATAFTPSSAFRCGEQGRRAMARAPRIPPAARYSGRCIWKAAFSPAASPTSTMI